MFLYYELFEQFMQHLHSETRYQTDKITNIFHCETLCTSFTINISTNTLKMLAKFKEL